MRNNKLLAYFAFTILLSSLIVIGKCDQQNLILKLDRQQTPSFIKYNDGEYADSLCNILSKQKISYSKQIKTPKKCGQDTEVTHISQNCLQKNLFYNTEVYLGQKKIFRQTISYKLAVDLMTPWTWVKGNECKSYSRDGETEKQGNCTVGNYSKAFTCKKEEKCAEVKKCAEIKYQSEGLSMSGVFADTQMRFKDLGTKDQGIYEQRIVMAQATSGMQLHLADGVLGLGKPPKEVVLKNTDKMDSKEQKESEEENKLEKNDDNDFADDNKGLNTYDYKSHSVEAKTSIFQNLDVRNTQADQRMFSIYISDNYEEDLDSDFKPSLELGGLNPDKFVFDYANNRMEWVDLVRERYYLWQVSLQSITLHKDTEELPYSKLQTMALKNPAKTLVLGSFEQTAIFSLSTTNIVLPADVLKQLVDEIQNYYNVQCKYTKLYMYNVYCYNMKKPLDFQGSYMVIKLEQGEIVVNPKDLVQKCQKQADKNNYECILNLQQSYDKHVILGEAAMKNYYWSFDIARQKIGFAPAKNKFNEKAFQVIEKQVIKSLEKIAEDVKYDVEFIIRFSAVIFLVIVSVIAFRNINAIISCIEKFIGTKERVRIQPHIPYEESFVNDSNGHNDDLLQFENDDKSDQENMKKQFEDFDNQTMDSQRQSILDKSKSALNPFLDDNSSEDNSLNSSLEKKESVELNELENGI